MHTFPFVILNWRRTCDQFKTYLHIGILENYEHLHHHLQNTRNLTFFAASSHRVDPPTHPGFHELIFGVLTEKSPGQTLDLSCSCSATQVLQRSASLAKLLFNNTWLHQTLPALTFYPPSPTPYPSPTAH